MYTEVHSVDLQAYCVLIPDCLYVPEVTAKLRNQEIVITQIEQPIFFLKEVSGVFSDDQWTAVLNYDLSQYTELLIRLKHDIDEIARTMKDNISLGELKLID